MEQRQVSLSLARFGEYLAGAAIAALAGLFVSNAVVKRDLEYYTARLEIATTEIRRNNDAIQAARVNEARYVELLNRLRQDMEKHQERPMHSGVQVEIGKIRGELQQIRLQLDRMGLKMFPPNG